MVFSDFHFYSAALRIDTAAYVLLPDANVLAAHNYAPVPTLYLLHGLSDDHTKWLRETRITRYARDYYVAIVMPAVNRSFYTDMQHGAAYWTFVSEELPQVMESYFPLSRARDGRFAAGLSMGGYGAMKLGLRCPDRYAAVASLSGALMLQDGDDAEEQREMLDIFGSMAELRAGRDNLCNLADALLPTPEKAPKIFVACGTEDFLFPANEAFIGRYGKALSIRYLTEKGRHTWEFWDRNIERVLAWLPLERTEGAR